MAEFLSPLGEATLLGATVRESDGIVNFTRVREARITILYLRATSGADYVDCKLNANYASARGKGGAERGLHALFDRANGRRSARTGGILPSRNQRTNDDAAHGNGV